MIVIVGHDRCPPAIPKSRSFGPNNYGAGLDYFAFITRIHGRLKPVKFGSLQTTTGAMVSHLKL